MENHTEQEGMDRRPEDELVTDLKHIEESILSIIAKIKKDRNRACIQNIHSVIQLWVGIFSCGEFVIGKRRKSRRHTK